MVDSDAPVTIVTQDNPTSESYDIGADGLTGLEKPLVISWH